MSFWRSIVIPPFFGSPNQPAPSGPEATHDHDDWPSWMRQPIALEPRSAFSWTGDVNLYAAPTFEHAYTSPEQALAHARAASIETPGAVAVLHDAGDFFLTRLHNRERGGSLGMGLEVVRSSIADAHRGFTNLNPHLVGIVDHDLTVRGTVWDQLGLDPTLPEGVAVARDPLPEHVPVELP